MRHRSFDTRYSLPLAVIRKPMRFFRSASETHAVPRWPAVELPGSSHDGSVQLSFGHRLTPSRHSRSEEAWPPHSRKCVPSIGRFNDCGLLAG
jgi:hypothetical protein